MKIFNQLPSPKEEIMNFLLIVTIYLSFLQVLKQFPNNKNDFDENKYLNFKKFILLFFFLEKIFKLKEQSMNFIK